MRTPWGLTDNVETDEIAWYSTPGHGGYHVTGQAETNIPRVARDASWAGHPWYEEDCDWVMVFNPDAFSADALIMALRTLHLHHLALYVVYALSTAGLL